MAATPHARTNDDTPDVTTLAGAQRLLVRQRQLYGDALETLANFADASGSPDVARMARSIAEVYGLRDLARPAVEAPRVVVTTLPNENGVMPLKPFSRQSGPVRTWLLDYLQANAGEHSTADMRAKCPYRCMNQVWNGLLGTLVHDGLIECAGTNDGGIIKRFRIASR